MLGRRKQKAKKQTSKTDCSIQTAAPFSFCTLAYLHLLYSSYLLPIFLYHILGQAHSLTFSESGKGGQC